MALPAGRYGVTKNQLLKIKKLPMNTIKLIEELTEKFDLLGSAAFKNSTSVVTQSTDLVESGAVYDALGFGNKNLFNYKLPTDNYGTTRKDIANGINIKSSSEIAWCNSYWVIPTIGKNTDATFSFDLDFVSGTFLLIIKGNNDGSGVATEITRGDVISSDQKVVISFNTGNYEYLIFSLYVTISTVTIGEANVTNIQLEKGTTATAYEPYHESVAESLETKADNSVIGTVEDGANPTKSYAVGEHFIRNGKFCTVTVAVTTSSTWTLDGNYVEGDVAQFTSLLFAGTIADIVSRLPIDNMSINCIIGSQLLLQLTSNTVNHTAFITVFKRGTEYAWYGKAAGADNEFCLGTFTANGYSNHRVI